MRHGAILGIVLAAFFLVTASPVVGQEYELFDRFSVGLGGSWLDLATTVRLDSRELGIGTEINFENDLNFKASKATPELGIQWRMGKRHMLTGSLYRADRNATEQVLTDIRFGDLVIPVDATVAASFDTDEYLLRYTFFPVVRDRVAFGVGLGARIIKITAFLEIVDLPPGEDPLVLSEEADATGPLPFLDLELRYGLAPKWRLLANVGYMTAKVGDYDGQQILADVAVEHLAAQHFSWGLRGDYSALDVDAEKEHFLGNVTYDVGRVGLFIKGRW